MFRRSPDYGAFPVSGGTKGHPKRSANRRQRIVCIFSVSAIAFLWPTYRSLWWVYKHSRCTSVERNIVWKEGPSHSMSRKCPGIPYMTMEPDGTKINPSSICITTLTAAPPSRCRDFDSVDTLTHPSWQQYADRHGYRLIDGSNMFDKTRPPSWSKIRAVQQAWGKGCTWVYWMDADMVVMNDHVRLETILPASSTSVEFVGSRDLHRIANAGAWIISNSTWSRSLLDEWWDMRDFIKPNGLSVSGDNDALVDMLSRKTTLVDAQHIELLPPCHFNSFAVFVQEGLEPKQAWQTEPEKFYYAGDFVAHAAGIDKKQEGVKLLLGRKKTLYD